MSIDCTKKRVLLAIPTLLDPETPGHSSGYGPIMQIVEKNNFDEVILLGLQCWRLNLFLTEQAIHTKFPKINVKRHILSIKNITDYNEIFYNLKPVLDSYDMWLKLECEDPVFLLPPSYFDRLLDCWLLLTTSLNIKSRICQIEPHYSVEGLYLKNSEDQNLDWLEENPIEFKDVSLEKSRGFSVVFTPLQVTFVRNLFQSNKSFCFYLKNKALSGPLLNTIFNNVRELGVKHLNIQCQALPEEIMQPILWGYSKSIEDATIQRKGLLSRLSDGWITLSQCDRLPLSIRESLSVFASKKELHLIGVSFQADKVIPNIPIYEIPE